MITLQGEQVQIDILDTAGQEDYTTVRDGYIKHGNGFIIVFDLTNRETFASVKFHRDTVLRVKEEMSNSLPIILLGNKCDLEADRKITYEEASGLAAMWKMPYIETSAKTKLNVDKAFSEIFVKIQVLLDGGASTVQEQSLPNGKDKKTNTLRSQLTEQEEKKIRADSLRKRMRKFLSDVKNRCSLM